MFKFILSIFLIFTFIVTLQAGEIPFQFQVKPYLYNSCNGTDSVFSDTFHTNIQVSLFNITNNDTVGIKSYLSRLAGSVVKDTFYSLNDGSYRIVGFIDLGKSTQCISYHDTIITTLPPSDTIPEDTTIIVDTAKVPDWRKLALVHYSEVICATPVQESLLAKRYRIVLDGGCSKDMDRIWSLTTQRPLWSFYITLTDLSPGSVEDNFIANYLQLRGKNPEIRFLHYSEATNVSFTTGSASILAGGRVMMYEHTGKRILRNLKDSDVIKATIEYSKNFLLSKPPEAESARFNIVYYDNAASDVLYNYGNVTLGGTVQEAGLKIFDTVFNQSWYPQGTKVCLEAAQDTLDKYNKHVAAFGNSSTDIDIQVTEYDPTPARYFQAVILNFYNAFKQRAQLFPKSLIMIEQTPVTIGLPAPGEEIAPGVVTSESQTSHAVKNDHSMRYCIDPTDSMVSGHSGPYQLYYGDAQRWIGLLGLSMGTRIAPVETAWKTGVDGVGNQVYIWRDQRVLSNGDTLWVLMRTKGNYGDIVGSSSRFLVDVPDSSWVYEPSGNLIGPVNSVYLRSGDSMFLRFKKTGIPAPTYNFKKLIWQ